MRWTKVLYEYCSHLSVRNRQKFEDYIYQLHRMYKEHLNALYDSMKLFPRIVYARKSSVYTLLFCNVLDDLRLDCLTIADDFFDEFNNYLVENHIKRKIERNKERKIQITYRIKIINFSLKYIPREFRFLICKFLINKRYINISYCTIYNKKKCPRKLRNL